MNNTGIEIPVAHCTTCDESGPVIVEMVPVSDGGDLLQLVFCPQCENLLNTETDVHIDWYAPEDLERVTGWRVKNG